MSVRHVVVLAMSVHDARQEGHEESLPVERRELYKNCTVQENHTLRAKGNYRVVYQYVLRFTKH